MEYTYIRTLHVNLATLLSVYSAGVTGFNSQLKNSSEQAGKGTEGRERGGRGVQGRGDGKLNASLAGNLVKPRYGLRPLYMIEFPLPLSPLSVQSRGGGKGKGRGLQVNAITA